MLSEFCFTKGWYLLLLSIQPQLAVLAIPIDQKAEGDHHSARDGDPKFHLAEVENPQQQREQYPCEHTCTRTVTNRDQ